MNQNTLIAGSLRVTHCELVFATRQLLANGVDVGLGGRAFDILVALIERRPAVVPKEELYRLVWQGLAVEPNNLQVQVWALRRLIGAGAIVTVARRGYQFTRPVLVADGERYAFDTAPDDHHLTADAHEQSRLGARHPALPELIVQIRRSRIVVVVDTQDHGAQALATLAAQHLSPGLAGGTWSLDGRDWAAMTGQVSSAGAAGPRSAQLIRLLERLARHRGLLILHHGDRLDDDTLAQLGESVRSAPELFLLLTARRPLPLVDAHRIVLDTSQGPAATC